MGSKILFDAVFKRLIRFAFLCRKGGERTEVSFFRARKRRVPCCRGGHIFVLYLSMGGGGHNGAFWPSNPFLDV